MRPSCFSIGAWDIDWSFLHMLLSCHNYLGIEIDIDIRCMPPRFFLPYQTAPLAPYPVGSNLQAALLRRPPTKLFGTCRARYPVPAPWPPMGHGNTTLGESFVAPMSSPP